MSSGISRDDLEARVRRLNRALGREASLFEQAVADRVGLAIADVECIDFVSESGRVTAGRLSELLGLTSGATTRVIDRLEQAGYVRRVPDPADRRRVVVEGVPERLQAFGVLHRSIDEAQRREIAAFSDSELELIATYLERAESMMAAESRKMRETEAESAEGGSFGAPLGAITRARVVFLSGAPSIVLRGDASLGELYRARFDGPVPRVRLRGSVVTIAYPRFGWFDWRTQLAGQHVEASVHWRKDRGEILLNPRVRWAIELRGGVSKLNADLRSIDLESVDIRGGGSKIELDLPAPSGIVPIRIVGGMSYLGIRRPAGAAVGLTLNGGAGYVELDGDRIKGSGRLSMESPGAGQARDRYELELDGGAGKVVVSAR